MKRGEASLMVIFLLVLSALNVVSVFLPVNVGATTLFVGGSGPGNYTTILSAVLIANPGDTIYVHSGWYGEGFDVTKPLTIVGEDRDITVIRGDGWFPTIRISSDWVNISGFTVTKRATGPGSTAFELTGANHCNISNNIILENEFGYYLFYANHTVIVDSVIKDGDVGIMSVTSHDLTIAGNNISSNNIGISLVISGNSTFQNNDFWFNTDYGIYLAHNHDGLIEGNRISSSAENGLDLYRSDWNEIRNNWISDHSVSGIILEYSNHNEITDNVISFNEALGIELDSSDDNLFVNNTITSSSDGASLTSSHGNTFRKNALLENSANGISVYHSEENIIEDNLVSGNYHGFTLFESNNTYIANNSVSDCEFGIYLFRTTDTEILDNDIDLTRVGIYLAYSINSTASGNSMIGNGIVVEGPERESWESLMIDSTNTVNGKPVYFLKNGDSVHVPSGYGQIIITGGSGIWVENLEITDTSSAVQVGYASNVFVLNNTISSNSWNGVRFESVRAGYVNDNIVISNGDRGISVWLSEDVKVTRNYIAHHSLFGIEVMRGERNFIFHNSIIGNGPQGYNKGVSNQWDNGYPSGGNYWSYYIYNDTFKGVNQDQPGSDGIGDRPHPLWDHSAEDRYPLMSPIVAPPPSLSNLQPDCHIDSPSDDSKVGGVVTIEGTASDPDGTVVKVEIRIGDSPWIETEGTTSWTFKWDSTKHSNGEVDIRVRSFDGVDYSEEVSMTVFVDNPEPIDLLVVGVLAAILIAVFSFIVILTNLKGRKAGKEPPDTENGVRQKK